MMPKTVFGSTYTVIIKTKDNIPQPYLSFQKAKQEALWTLLGALGAESPYRRASSGRGMRGSTGASILLEVRGIS